MPATYRDHNPKHEPQIPRYNILLSNGRFPVTLDLARQLRKAGHNVYTVDPMEFHVCKFSRYVKKSWQTPAPSDDPTGYINVVKKAIKLGNIDMIIPLHEEILYLTECLDQEITQRLFAPNFLDIYQLHNKWEFTEVLGRVGLDRPEAYFCTSTEHVEKLDKSREWALKPILGRASTGVHHLKPGKEEDLSGIVSSENPHIAQEWLKGNRYCTYGVFRDGHVQAFAIYPVLDTIDGSSSVYFEAVEHDEIKDYVKTLTEKLRLTGQFAFDFIETGVTEGELRRGPHGIPRGDLYRTLGRRKRQQTRLDPDHSAGENDTQNVEADTASLTTTTPRRLVAIECNPRATSGIHLWSGTPKLAMAFTDVHRELAELAARPGRSRQTAPGMLMMWDHKEANTKRYFQHLTRLLGTKDVTWSWADLMPSLMQPFLLASYYRICHDKGGMPLPEMFQSDVVWEPGMFGESKKMGLKPCEPLERSRPEVLLRPKVQSDLEKIARDGNAATTEPGTGADGSVGLPPVTRGAEQDANVPTSQEKISNGNAR